MGAGRAIVHMRADEAVARRLREAGWHVHENVAGRIAAVGEFASFEEACAAPELPTGVPVSWSDGELFGGFIAGAPGVAPPLGPPEPAFVLWPDGSQQLAPTRDAVAAALRERLDWLVGLAREAGLDDALVETGARDARAALDAGGPITTACLGPVHDVRCAASVESVARLRWTGFKAGWEDPEHDHGPPCHSGIGGELRRVWRAAFEEGAAAAARSPGAVRSPIVTEEEWRARRVEDPELRAWVRELVASLGELLRDYHQLTQDGSAGQAAAAGERLRSGVRTALADLDARPSQDESVARARATVERLGASVERLLAEAAA